ncbi:MAG: SseB family protein [Lapillicoccus sp.]
MTPGSSGGHATEPDGSAVATASWSGRTLPASGFEDDSGEPDPRLVAALAAPARRPTARRERDLLDAVAGARWLVPVVAVHAVAVHDVAVHDVAVHDVAVHDVAVHDVVGGAMASAAAGRGEHAVEASTDLAVVLVTGPGGQRGLPVFTGLSALQAWSASARPVPVSSAAAARAALSEGCEVMLVDPGCEHAAVLRPSMVWALAERRPWLPGHLDPVVAEGVRRSVTAEDVVGSHAVDAGEPAGVGIVRVSLALRAGLGREQVRDVLARIGERVASDAQVRVRLDGLAFRVTSTGASPERDAPPSTRAASPGEGVRP